MSGWALAWPALFAAWSGLAEPLTLDEALAIAERNAFAVGIARSEVERTRQRIAEARGRLGPQVRVDTTYTRNEREVRQGGFLVQHLDSAQSQLILSMPLDVTGVLKKGVNAAGKAIDVAKANLDAERNDLRLDVRTAYFLVLQTQAQVAVFQEAQDSAAKRLRNTELEVRAGAKAQVDVLRFQTQLQQAEADLIVSENALSLAKRSFNLALARPIETPVELAPVQAMPQPAEDESALAAVARANRPELRALEANQTVLQKIREAEEGGMLPSLDVQGIHARNWSGSGFGSQDRSTFARLNLSVPVFDSGVTRARIKQARQDELQNRIRIEQTELGISLEVRQALANLNNAQARLESAAKQAEFAAEVFRLAGIRYEAGEAILIEVTDAQTELTRAKSLLVAATYDYMIAHAQLQRALGTDVQPTATSRPTQEKQRS
jgi:outer membrane protein